MVIMKTAVETKPPMFSEEITLTKMRLTDDTVLHSWNLTDVPDLQLTGASAHWVLQCGPSHMSWLGTGFF